jgi:hypothetical protein
VFHNQRFEYGENSMKRLLGLCFGIVFVLGTAGTAGAECFPVDQPAPDGCYRLASSRCSLGTPGTFSSVCTNTDGTVGANFASALDVRRIGSGWASWSVPPWAEHPNPQGSLVVGFNGAGNLTVNLTADASIAGMEIEQNIFDDPYVTTAQFRDASGAVVATISRSMLGRAGARLFGVECTDPVVRSIQITTESGAQGFAIAQVRSDQFSAGATDSISVDLVTPIDLPVDTMMNTD